MSGNSRIVLVIIGFLLMVGVFVFVQDDRDEDDRNSDLPLVVEEPRVDDGFQPAVGEPQALPRDAQSVSEETDSTPDAVSPPGADGNNGTMPLDDTNTAVTTRAFDKAASSRIGPGDAPSGDITEHTSILAPSPGQPNAGPGADENAPVTEMISLPPSGLGPETAGSGNNVFPPEHGSTESTVGPEFGAEGTLGPAPELLPVNQLGPSGEVSGELPPPIPEP